MRWAVAPMLIALVTAGCSGDRAEVPAAEIVDSAGTRIVTYDLTDRATPLFRTVGEPDLEIGVADGGPEYAFSRIGDLAVASDGSIIVSDEVAQELRVYAPDGTYLRTLGGRGEGPGEFATAPNIAGTAGDTVFAFDRRSRRVTSYLLAGDLVEMVTMASDDAGRPIALVRRDDGTYLSQSRWVRPTGQMEFYDVRLELDSLVVEHLDASGSLLDTLRVMADRTLARTVQDGGGGRVRLLQAQTPYGAQAVLGSDGGRAILGRSDTFELELLGPAEQSRTLLRVLGVRHPATADEIRAFQEARLREDLGDVPIDPMVRRLNIDFLPERLPAFGDVVVSDEGDLWVSLSELDLSEGLDWLVFTPAGELRGTVHTPPGMRLRSIRDGVVVGFVLDELEVPYVRRYPLLAGEAGGS